MENDINNKRIQANNKLIIIGLRLLNTVIIIVVVIMNTTLALALPPEEDINLIIDKVHHSSTHFNFMHFDEYILRNYLLIASSIMMDISFIVSLVYFTTKSKSWKILISILLYLSIKIILECVYRLMATHKYDLWIYPGFSYIIVTVLKSEPSFYLIVNVIFYLFYF